MAGDGAAQEPVDGHVHDWQLEEAELTLSGAATTATCWCGATGVEGSQAARDQASGRRQPL